MIELSPTVLILVQMKSNLDMLGMMGVLSRIQGVWTLINKRKLEMETFVIDVGDGGSHEYGKATEQVVRDITKRGCLE